MNMSPVPAAGVDAAPPPAARVLVVEPAPALAAETAVARGKRHRAVAARRDASPVVMVHRGFAALAPENSIEACAAALDYGADGVEVDLRRTRDGVLVLFADDTLDGVTDGFGSVDQLTYQELARLPRNPTSNRGLARPPATFPALLDLARERNLLLHLDLKEPGLDAEIANLLDAAEAWDHVVAINPRHAGILLAHPRYQPLRYKGPGLYERRLDLSPAAVTEQLAAPGQMILVDDPRVATRVLKRAGYQPQPFTVRYNVARRPLAPEPSAPPGSFQPMAHLRSFTNRIDVQSAAALLALLPTSSAITGEKPAAAEARRIVERAWAARQLGILGRKSSRVVAALERMLQTPEAPTDWRYQGLDTAQAIQALARLGATRSVPALIDCYRRSPAGGAGARDPNNDAREERVRLAVMAALGELPGRGARKFLAELVARPAAADDPDGDDPLAAATRALLRQKLTWTAVAGLLRSENPVVRGTALEECLRGLTEERKLALRQTVPWALELPRGPLPSGPSPGGGATPPRQGRLTK